MKMSLSSFGQAIVRSLRRPGWRTAPLSVADSPVSETPESFHGLFQGVIESAVEEIPAIGSTIGASAGIVHRSAAKACGFVRVEIDRQKKATGAFLLFSEGEVLSGTVEGSTGERGQFVEARFQLEAKSASRPPSNRAVLTLARGHLDMAGVHLQRPPENERTRHDGEDLTIRFV